MRVDSHSYTVDLICSYNRKITLLKLITDKENQYTLEMDILTKRFIFVGFRYLERLGQAAPHPRRAHCISMKIQ